jgi:hypothetical protein
MVRLTVLYNLAPGQDEKSFLAWRLGDHQAENAAQPGVVYTDFALVEEAWPVPTEVPYRFMTTAVWPDMASFRAAFYSPEQQADLRKNLGKLANPLFLVSEILTISEP